MLAAALPVFGVFAEAEWIHWVLTALAILASVSVIYSAPDARNVSFLAPAALGLVFITFAVFAENFGVEETPPTVIGGLLLAGAHGFRIFAKR